jgi:hypothetical protein
MSTSSSQYDPSADDARRAERLRHTRILYASVTGVMVLVVAVWIVLVPARFESFSLFDAEEQQGWSEIKAATDRETEAFRASVDSMKGMLQEFAAQEEAAAAEGEITTAPALNADDIETLRVRIEEANQKNHTEPDDNGQQETNE